MKVKDVMYLVVSMLIFLVIGVWAVATFSKKPTGEQAQYEVVKVISNSFDETALEIISDTNKVRDFTIPIDLQQIGNPKPFLR